MVIVWIYRCLRDGFSHYPVYALKTSRRAIPTGRRIFALRTPFKWAGLMTPQAGFSAIEQAGQERGTCYQTFYPVYVYKKR